MQPVVFQVQNSEEFQDMVDRKDYRISKAIVEQLLNNIDNKRNKLLLFSVAYPTTTYDYMVERKDFIDTLNQNLEICKREEDYETCGKIKEAIKKLENE